MIHLKTSKKQPSITINPTFTNNVTQVQYPTIETDPAYEGLKPEAAEKLAERDRQIEVLKLIISILQDNPLIINRYIIADDEALARMIKLLCNAETVQIDAEDLGQGCMTKHTYRKIHSIYVVKDGQTLNLKYDFPAVMKTLQDLRISTKFVF